MKILRIIARLNVGGPARHVVWLTQALQTGEYTSELVAGTVPPGEEDMSYFAESNGVAPVYIAELSRELSPKDIVSLWKVYRQMRVFSPDIIHTHTAKAGTIGRIAAFAYRWFTFRTLMGRPRRIRVVHTFHGHVFHSYYGKAKTNVFLLIEKVLARFATDRIVTISEQQFREIHERFHVGRRAQFRVVPLGIDPAEYRSDPAARKRLRVEIGAETGDIVVGFVGRLTAIKNIGLLLTAAKIIASDSSCPQFKFVILGDGELRRELEETAAAYGLTSSVRFLGHRPNVAETLAGMDIVALTSDNEGTPLSLIEAMACGVPFVSTAVGGVIDLAGERGASFVGFDVFERGVLTPAGSSQAFADALLYLAADADLRASMAANGKQFVERSYSTERLISDIKQLYAEMTSG